MNSKVDHVIEVRAVNEEGEVNKKNPFNPSEIGDRKLEPKDNDQVKTAAITTTLQQAGKSMFLQGLGSYGTLTGDYLTQNKINQASSIALKLAAIAINPVAGLIYAGVDAATQGAMYFINKEIHDTRAAAMRERRGIIAKSGGRL
ncbi:MAG: hypothetical protein BWY97_00085 [Tenericutes bacterium ADurb.BinA124]|nr:MAG: hypothetical protein BWY97_00085 [Tenericutes bacterium ADurb.BinA124]